MTLRSNETLAYQVLQLKTEVRITCLHSEETKGILSHYYGRINKKDGI